MLEARTASGSLWIFPDETGESPYLIFSPDHQHKGARTLLQLSKKAVIHSLRHTMLTRWGELGVAVFTIMRIAGHSSVTVSERYVHPGSESMERASAKLQEFNERANEQLPAPIPATVPSSETPALEGGLQQIELNKPLNPYAPVAQVDRATVS